MKTTGHAMRSNLRAWWKEALIVIPCALLIGLAFLLGGQQRNAMLTLGGYTAVIAGIGWATGFAHRHRPIWDVIRGMDGKLDAALTDEKPEAEVRHLHSV